VSKFEPPKVNPFAALFGQRPQKAAEPPRRLSMRAMKAVDLKRVSADDILEVDEFSVASELVDEGEGQDRREEELAKAGRQQKDQPQQAKKKDRKDLPALRPEAFGAPETARPLDGPKGPELQRLPPRPVDPKFTALVALDNAQEPGVFFQEDQGREGHSEEQEDPELREAVEECIRLLFGVRGIHHVGPGKNERGEPVIVISASDGFTAESMKVVPERVHRFATLIALPFDLVPLRRAR